MNSKVEQPKAASAGDIVKYALALLLVAAGVFAFYWFGEWPTALRALAVIGGLVAGAVVFLTTLQGRADPRIPLRVALRTAQGGLADPPGSQARDR